MKLREYLTTQSGTYMLAESHVSLSPGSFPDGLLEQEVEVYCHGHDAAGHPRYHLYVGGRHLATHLGEGNDESTGEEAGAEDRTPGAPRQPASGLPRSARSTS